MLTTFDAAPHRRLRRIGPSGVLMPAANYVRGAEYAGARSIPVNLVRMATPNPAFKEQYLGPRRKSRQR
jgi:hypothetical protein